MLEFVGIFLTMWPFIPDLLLSLIGIPLLAYFLYRCLGSYVRDVGLFVGDEMHRMRRRALVVRHAASAPTDTPRIDQYVPREVTLAVSEVLEQIAGTHPLFRAGDDLKRDLLLCEDDIESVIVLSSQRLNLWWPTVRAAFRFSPPQTLGDIVQRLAGIYIKNYT